ncbi:MAG TPA: LuxR C-terminal-related transcriptional regulator, partial [Candidatus Limnocylindrales bacterium]|nr:LuxR C-terminal-related transcriptional regulator [Candidatus Limnocylindrales bacterium]
MSAIRGAASLVNLADLLPPPTLDQVRRKLHLGIWLRWILIGVIAAGSMLTPQVATLLLYLLAVAAAYNAAVMVAVARGLERWPWRIALAVTIVDHLFCFMFLGIYASHVAGSQPLGGYAMGTIEGVFYFGVPGAALSIAIFAVCAVASHLLALPLFGHLFDGPGIFNSLLMLSMIAVVLVAALRIRLAPAEARSGAGKVVALVPDEEPVIRLSRREREVLSLVAEGYSNAMIAN